MSELDEVAGEFHACLDRDAVGYLRGRGVERDTAVAFRLGVAAGDLSPEWEQYRGFLSIPYVNGAGVQDIRFRSLSDEGPKYLSRAGQSPLLFNSRALMSGGRMLVVCEGEFDAMMVWQATGLPAVAVPGAATWGQRPHWSRMVRPFQRVLVLADGDPAGRDLGKAIAGSVEQAKVLPMPAGQDVSDFTACHGADALRSLITRAYSRSDGVT